ncbi:MAG: Maf family protein [Saprospiraceae bacterium]|nr:Maf family protein [Saprospiraceae bacterium]
MHLGSQSPRRQELMTLMGIPFEVRVSMLKKIFRKTWMQELKLNSGH